ncbi:MAG: GNAT family N-acetyltransferase [Micrococcales bacterium]|nr:GNAT family N-acetyltransferase [Micrococcales bacterium]
MAIVGVRCGEPDGEALRSRFAWDELGLHRVEATCRPGNLGSERVLRELGMQQDGVMRSHVLIRGNREDSLLFATVAGDRPAPADFSRGTGQVRTTTPR